MTTQLQHADWLTGGVPDGVRQHIRKLVEVLGYLPRVQPLGVVTADGVLLAANQPLLDLLGVSGEDMLGGDWADVMPGWSPRMEEWDREIEPRTHLFEDHLDCAGPRRAWVHVVATPVLTEWKHEGGPAAEPPALAAWTVFVSDSSPNEPPLEERRRREVLDLFLESPGEFAVRLDGEGRVEFASPSLSRALGVRDADLVGRPMDAYTGAAGGEDLSALWAELGSPPFRAEREMAMSSPAGARRVAWTFEALIQDGAAVRGVFGLGRDVTERRAAEDAVRRRLELETMLAAISARLSDSDTADVDVALDFALAEFGNGITVDEVGVHTLAADRASTACWKLWRRGEGVSGGTEGRSLAGLPWLKERLQAHETVRVSAVDDLPEAAAAERELWRASGSCSTVVAPLVADSLLCGYLTLSSRGEQRDWSEDDLHVVHVLADQLASRLMRAEDARHLGTVSETFLSFGPDCARNIEEVCAAAAAVTGADFVLYTRRAVDDIELVASWKAPPDLPRLVAGSGGLCYDSLMHLEDDVRHIPDLQGSVYAHSSPIVRTYGLKTFVGYPVRIGSESLAALAVFFHSGIKLRASQLELIRVLGRAAAVEESRRRADEERMLGIEQLEQAMERTVATLSSALGARDPYTEGHELRVAALATAIGQALGMNDDELRLLNLAATIHDIGKIVVPVEFLSKPTRLTEPEFAIIQRHCEAGYDLLRPAALPDEVMDAVLQHHERLDGSGYPQSLHGDAIGTFSRILAVADVAEAMSSDRPYRPALGLERALEEIESGRDRLFDPAACDACLSLFRSGSFDFSVVQ